MAGPFCFRCPERALAGLDTPATPNRGLHPRTRRSTPSLRVFTQPKGHIPLDAPTHTSPSHTRSLAPLLGLPRAPSHPPRQPAGPLCSPCPPPTPPSLRSQVEDIVDSGRTAAALVARYTAAGAASVALASLLSKPSRRVVSYEPDYLCFEVEDKFVVRRLSR